MEARMLIPWLHLSAHTQHSFAESETSFFFWNLGNSILGKVRGEVIQIDNDNIYYVGHLVKFNLHVRYPALFEFIQSLVFFLSPIDQGTITRVYKQIQRLLTANNILIFETMII